MLSDLTTVSQEDAEIIRKECSDQLLKCGANLQGQIISTEKEFLSIGERLSDFYRRAGEIAGISSSVANLISGEEFSTGTNRFPGILERIKSYLEHSKSELHRVEISLKNILKTHDAVYLMMSGFKKIVKDLRMLGIHIKILSSELAHDGGDFKNLAGDIVNLAGIIESKSNAILIQSKSSDLLIRETILKVTTLKTGLDNLTMLIIEGTMSTLSSLTERHKLSSVTARNISSGSQEISQGIGKVLESLQIQDIVRQRLEHVKKSLETLDIILNKTDIDASDPKLIREISNTCNFQTAQLDYSRDELLSAVKSIVENLRKIAKGITHMSANTRNLAGESNKEGASFFKSMEAGIVSVLSSISESFFECSKTDHELSGGVNAVVCTIGSISVFIKDIEHIGMEMELLSLNARIKSAHAGHEGAGLSVLAEAIQQISEDVCNKTIAVSNTFAEITSSAEALNNEISSENKEKDAEIEVILNDMETVLHSLRSVNNSVISFLKEIGEKGQRLGNDIEKAILEVTVHETFVSGINEAISGLKAITRQASNLIPYDTIDYLPRFDRFEAIRPMANVELF